MAVAVIEGFKFGHSNMRNPSLGDVRAERRYNRAGRRLVEDVATRVFDLTIPEWIGTQIARRTGRETRWSRAAKVKQGRVEALAGGASVRAELSDREDYRRLGSVTFKANGGIVVEHPYDGHRSVWSPPSGYHFHEHPKDVTHVLSPPGASTSKEHLDDLRMMAARVALGDAVLQTSVLY